MNARLDDWQLCEIVMEDGAQVLYRARRQDASALLRVVREANQSAPLQPQWERELELVRQWHLPGLLLPQQLAQFQQRLAIQYPDFAGVSLDRWLQMQAPDLADKLQVALNLLDILAALHGKGGGCRTCSRFTCW